MVKVELIIDDSEEGRRAEEIFKERGVPYVIPDVNVIRTIPHANADKAYYGLDGIQECAEKYGTLQKTSV